MLTVRYETSFKRDFKRAVKRGCDMRLLEEIIDLLVHEQPLPEKNRDHKLIGEYVDCRECHIAADWLLMYRVQAEELLLILMRTGSHSDLF